MSMSWNTEYDLRRAIRNGDEERVEEILRRDGYANFGDVMKIFEDERKGRIRYFEERIEFGDLEIRNRFGRTEVRKWTI